MYQVKVWREMVHYLIKRIYKEDGENQLHSWSTRMSLLLFKSRQVALQDLVPHIYT